MMLNVQYLQGVPDLYEKYNDLLFYSFFSLKKKKQMLWQSPTTIMFQNSSNYNKAVSVFLFFFCLFINGIPVEVYGLKFVTKSVFFFLTQNIIVAQYQS